MPKPTVKAADTATAPIAATAVASGGTGHERRTTVPHDGVHRYPNTRLASAGGMPRRSSGVAAPRRER